MRSYRFFVGYVFSLALIPVSIFSFFHKKLGIFLEEEFIDFYIMISSAFFYTLAILLSWYYSFLENRGLTIFYINRFFGCGLSLDSNKISLNNMLDLSKNFVFNLCKKEKSRIILYSCSIPMILSFLSILSLMIMLNPHYIYQVFIAATLIFILSYFLHFVLKIFDIQNQGEWIDRFSAISILCSKGVQFYNAKKTAITKILDYENELWKRTKAALSKDFFRIFFYSCLLFLFLCLSFILISDFIKTNLIDISQDADLFFLSLFLFSVFIISFLENFSDSKISIELLDDFADDEPKSEKELSKDNLFIAFHNVCFQNPTEVSDRLIIKDLSFSVLPGEVVALTGEDISDVGKYVFELLLKYYKLQSGEIYVSGMKLETIKTQSIRKLVSIFRLDFGLIAGTVFENLKLASPNQDSDKIEHIADRVGLFDSLDLLVYDEMGNFCISQEVMIRIQIARIYMQKPKVVLIETPEYFENELIKEIFEVFVQNMSKRKTVIIMTQDMKTIVYANKILFFEKDKSYFGTPAELSKLNSYAKYFKSLKNID